MPFLPLCYRVWVVARWPWRDTFDVAFCTLFVETVELESIGRWGPSGACSRDTFDSVQGMDENSVCVVGIVSSAARGAKA